MKIRTLVEADIIDLLFKAIDRLPGHPWIRTESDVKCAIYTNFFNLLRTRIANLEKCYWSIVTELTLPLGGSVDFAVLHHNSPFLLIELKYVRSLDESKIQLIDDDYRKRETYICENGVRFLQLIVSTTNGQWKRIIRERLVGLYGNRHAPNLDCDGADVQFIRIEKAQCN